MGSGVTRLTHNGVLDAYPAWSPDGSRIAFHSMCGVRSIVGRMDADGTNRDESGDGSVLGAQPCWSPDSSWIAFVASVDGFSELWAMEADGTGNIRLTGGKAADWCPSWSPDGRRIAFVSDRDYPAGVHGANNEIYVMDVSEVFPDVVAAMAHASEDEGR